jgi:MFS family permease
MLWVSIAANVVALAAIPAWATLADRIGRKPVFIFGTLGSGALMFAYLAAIAPTAAAWIAGDGPAGWVPVAAYVLVSSAIAAAAVMTARETFRVPLSEIDGREKPRMTRDASASPETPMGAGVR